MWQKMKHKNKEQAYLAVEIKKNLKGNNKIVANNGLITQY